MNLIDGADAATAAVSAGSKGSVCSSSGSIIITITIAIAIIIITMIMIIRLQSTTTGQQCTVSGQHRTTAGHFNADTRKHRQTSFPEVSCDACPPLAPSLTVALEPQQWPSQQQSVAAVANWRSSSCLIRESKLPRLSLLCDLVIYLYPIYTLSPSLLCSSIVRH